MDRVEEIEAAIINLQPDEYERIVQWFRTLDQAQWDVQLDRDASAGNLDFLFREADNEAAEQLVREWPQSK